MAQAKRKKVDGYAANAFFRADAFIKFLDLHTEYRDAEWYGSERKGRYKNWGGGQTIDATIHYGTFINGVKRAKGSADQRAMCRWRQGGGVALDTADKLLLRYNLTLTEFEDWAEETGQEYLINQEDKRYG